MLLVSSYLYLVKIVLPDIGNDIIRNQVFDAFSPT